MVRSQLSKKCGEFRFEIEIPRRRKVGHFWEEEEDEGPTVRFGLAIGTQAGVGFRIVVATFQVDPVGLEWFGFRQEV